ncbi:LuxR C-terminal-related transcriptional regulator [Streptomyces sp. NPDC005805]|uniref:LuxR C-terminal-related transcriptional regulator n=1 Tax=Streptomyces sp. NPDC005805 TaxID=3157068 RepID=UPI0034077E7D
MSAPVLATRTWPFTGRAKEFARALSLLNGRSPRTVVIVGRSGTGKSRLARECVARASAQGRPALYTAATAVSRQVPLGALAPILAPGTSRTPRELRSALHGSGRGTLLLVDDLHLLDAESWELLTPLVRSGQLRLIGTMNTDGAVEGAARRLEAFGPVGTLALDPLPEQVVLTLLENALGAPFERRTALTLSQLSRGRPLHLRELTLGAVDQGELVQEDGVWRLSGRLRPSARLIALVRHQLGRVGEADLELLTDLALCGPERAERLPADACRRLADQELVSAGRAGAGDASPCWRLTDPVQGLVLRAVTAEHVARRILLARAERTDHATSGRQDRDGADFLRSTLWRVRASEAVPAERLLRAIEVARAAHDAPAALRLARALVMVRDDCRAHLLLGEFSHECGHRKEAHSALERAQELAGTREDWLLGVVLRTRTLAHGFMRIDRALAVNREARLAASPEAEGVLRANEAALLCFAGDVAAASRLLDEVPADNPAAALLAVTPRAYCASETGRPAAALELPPPDTEDCPRATAVLHPSIFAGTRARVLAEAGRLDEAEREAQAAYDLAVETRSGTEQIWCGLHLGWISHLRGAPNRARSWFICAVTRSRQQGYQYGLWAGLIGRALAESTAGDSEAAVMSLTAAREVRPASWTRPEQHLAEGWCEAALGRLSRARTVLTEGARMAERAGLLVTESHLLFDVARLGDARSVAGRLRKIADRCENPFVTARAEAAHALAHPSGEGLAAAAERFRGFGALLSAAELLTAAGGAYRSEGARSAAERTWAEAQEAAGGCEGAVSPGLIPHTLRSELTPRELEVCLLAARGLGNTEIARQLDLSVRTVGNHLQHVYAKTGIRDRAVLRDAVHGAA